MKHRYNWGEDRVYFHDDDGKLVSIPASWTSLSGRDPFVAVAAGRSEFRLVDLMELADLLSSLVKESRQQHRVGRKRGVK